MKPGITLYIFTLILLLPRLIFGQSPVITPKANPIILTLDATGNYAVKLADIATVTTANGAVPVVSYSPQSFDCKTQGRQNITVTAINSTGGAPPNPAAISLGKPNGLIFDGNGNLFIAEDGHTIRKIDRTGNATYYTGNAMLQGYVNGPLNVAMFNSLGGMVLDKQGNLYVADIGNNSIRKIAVNGIVSTFAGDQFSGFVDGAADVARFYHPEGLAIDNSGNIYVSDSDNNAIRKISPAGYVTTIAGNGSPGYAEGTGSAARFTSPYGICIDPAGNLYVADSQNFAVRKITPAGEVSTFAGSGTYGQHDGTGTAASFSGPYGITIDAAGNIYTGDNEIRQITPAGTVTTIAGSDKYGSADGQGAAATFSVVTGICIDAAGAIYATDIDQNRLRLVCTDGIVSTLAGDGSTIPRNGNIGSLENTGCPVRAVIPVIVTDPTGSCLVKPVTVPNTFTPNGDGINDLWNIPDLVNYPACSVLIYNRYGQVAFNSTGYSKPWDGAGNGKPLPAGVYYYIIKLGEGQQQLSGNVTIIR